MKNTRAKAGSQDGLVVRLSRNEGNARVAALEEAAEHLEMEWTENEEERHQGSEVAHLLRQAAQKVFELSRSDNASSSATPNEGGSHGA